MKLNIKLRTGAKALRLKMNLTQEKFAKLIGVNRVTVANWEMKKGSSPSKLAMAKLRELGLQEKREI